MDVRVDDHQDGVAHDKVMIIDRMKVITGSFNYSFPAENKNGENLVIIEHAAVTSQYLENWERHWSHSTSFIKPRTQAVAGAIGPEEAVKRNGHVCNVRMSIARAREYGGFVYLNWRAPYNLPGNLAF
jgi:phosphatidylserine/phosphatidylglycerophosphate/cardiolipin synthase-like enzyme